MPTIHLRLHNPRYGHEDRYEIRMYEDRVEFALPPRTAVCHWREGRDPEWSGGQSIDDILTNDSIYAPAVFTDLVVWAWEQWRDRPLVVNEETLQREFDAVADWINAATAAKPRSDFWRVYF